MNAADVYDIVQSQARPQLAAWMEARRAIVLAMIEDVLSEEDDAPVSGASPWAKRGRVYDAPEGWTTTEHPNGTTTYEAPNVVRIRDTRKQGPTRFQIMAWMQPTVLVEGRIQPSGEPTWTETAEAPTWEDARRLGLREAELAKAQQVVDDTPPTDDAQAWRQLAKLAPKALVGPDLYIREVVQGFEARATGSYPAQRQNPRDPAWEIPEWGVGDTNPYQRLLAKAPQALKDWMETHDGVIYQALGWAQGRTFWHDGLPPPKRGKTYSKPEIDTIKARARYHPDLDRLEHDIAKWEKTPIGRIARAALHYDYASAGNDRLWPNDRMRYLGSEAYHYFRHYDSKNMADPAWMREALGRLRRAVAAERLHMEFISDPLLYDRSLERVEGAQRAVDILRRGYVSARDAMLSEEERAKLPSLPDLLWECVLKWHGVDVPTYSPALGPIVGKLQTGKLTIAQYVADQEAAAKKHAEEEVAANARYDEGARKFAAILDDIQKRGLKPIAANLTKELQKRYPDVRRYEIRLYSRGAFLVSHEGISKGWSYIGPEGEGDARDAFDRWVVWIRKVAVQGKGWQSGAIPRENPLGSSELPEGFKEAIQQAQAQIPIELRHELQSWQHGYLEGHKIPADEAVSKARATLRRLYAPALAMLGGHVRLFRGEAPDEVKTHRAFLSWTDHKGDATSFAGPAGTVRVADVPTSRILAVLPHGKGLEFFVTSGPIRGEKLEAPVFRAWIDVGPWVGAAPRSGKTEKAQALHMLKHLRVAGLEWRPRRADDDDYWSGYSPKPDHGTLMFTAPVRVLERLHQADFDVSSLQWAPAEPRTNPHKKPIDLFRAAKSSHATPGMHFSPDQDVAEAYAEPEIGHGGPIVYAFHVDVDPDRVLRVPMARDLARVYARLADLNEQEVRDEWSAAGYWPHVFHVLENAPEVEQALSHSYDWIVYLDDYPEGATTWKYLRGPALKGLADQPRTNPRKPIDLFSALHALEVGRAEPADLRVVNAALKARRAGLAEDYRFCDGSGDYDVQEMIGALGVVQEYASKMWRL